jgi:mono/diheme cytochrome c family protein
MMHRFTNIQVGLLLAALLIIQVIAMFGSDTEVHADEPIVQILNDEELVEHGKYLATAGNCAACHTTTGGGYMAGGVAIETPFGQIYSTNITPDTETGIGNWSLEDFQKSMSQGVRPDGQHLYPAFPYTAFTKLTDTDTRAIFFYLKSLPPVRQTASKNGLGFPFNQRWLMAVWKALYFEPGIYKPDESSSEKWNRGAYLVEALAHCSACHTPRNMLGAEKADLAMAGGMYSDDVPQGAVRQWYAPNLRSDVAGLNIWTYEQLADYLKTGRNALVETFGPMNEVIMGSTRNLHSDDIDAMATYLKSLPLMEEEHREVAEYQIIGRGRTVYNLHCGTCHLPTGLGDKEMGPRLAKGSLVVLAENPASLINVILYGPERSELPNHWYEEMGEFQYELDDEEIAAVASYVRQSWGNPGGIVTARDVAKQR